MIPTHGLAPRASDGASQSEWPINPVKITVDKNGHAWVVDINGGIWRYMGPNYIKVDGYAVDIAAGGDGSIYTVDAYNEIVIPALTIGGIAAYGFMVWFMQILNGPPGS